MSSPTLPSPNKVSAASCLSGRSFKTETCVFLTYCLGIFQFVAFALALRALGFARDFRAKGKSRISMSSISLSLLALITFDFQQQKYWDLVFLVPAPSGGVPNVKLSPFSLHTCQLRNIPYTWERIGTVKTHECSNKSSSTHLFDIWAHSNNSDFSARKLSWLTTLWHEF